MVADGRLEVFGAWYGCYIIWQCVPVLDGSRDKRLLIAVFKSKGTESTSDKIPWFPAMDPQAGSFD